MKKRKNKKPASKSRNAIKSSPDQTNIKSKVVLVIAYYFPPFKFVGSVRSGKFAKYLPFNDWTPWVVTVDPRYYGDSRLIHDPRLQSELASTRVIRAPYKYFLDHVFIMKIFFPLFVLGFAWKHRNSLDAVYISGGPFYPFLLTIPLTGLMGIASIIDFRDSWSINHGFGGEKKNSLFFRFLKIIKGAVEYMSIRFASRVVFSTRKLQTEYANLFPNWKWKYSTIHNGYDFKEITKNRSNDSNDFFNMIIAGKFCFYTPKAIHSLMQSLHATNELHLTYIGEEQNLFIKSAMQAKVSPRVMALPHMAYTEAIKWIARSDIGIVSNGVANGLGSKIFDYLALGKPVVCLVPEDSVIVSEFADLPQVIVSHPPHTTEKIIKALQTALKLVGSDPPENIKKFSRFESCRQLARLLDDIT